MIDNSKSTISIVSDISSAAYYSSRETNCRHTVHLNVSHSTSTKRKIYFTPFPLKSAVVVVVVGNLQRGMRASIISHYAYFLFFFLLHDNNNNDSRHVQAVILIIIANVAPDPSVNDSAVLIKFRVVRVNTSC